MTIADELAMTDAPPMNDADLRALCERLLSYIIDPDSDPRLASDIQEAADAIEALVAERDALRAQLESDKFWSHQVYPDGLTAEGVRAELADYHFLLGQVPKVYDSVTGGRLSKTNYNAEVVIAQADDYTTRLCEEAVDEATTELRAEVAELRKHAEALDKMRKALQGIASCATQCEGCQMLARIAREALK